MFDGYLKPKAKLSILLMDSLLLFRLVPLTKFPSIQLRNKQTKKKQETQIFLYIEMK